MNHFKKLALLVILGVGILLSPEALAGTSIVDSDPANPLRKGMTRSDPTAHNACRSTIRSGDWCWFMFGLNSVVDTTNGATTTTGTTTAYKASAGGARVCLQPDELVNAPTEAIAGTDVIIYTYIGATRSGFNSTAIAHEDTRRFANSTITSGCYDVDPYAIFYLEFTTVAPGTDQPYAVVWGLPQRDQ